MQIGPGSMFMSRVALKRSLLWSMCAIASAVLLGLIFSVRETEKIRQSVRRCYGNMSYVSSSKAQWALEADVTSGPVDETAMRTYLKGGHIDLCPLGGEYRIGLVEEELSCSFHGSPRAAYDGSEENIERIRKKMRAL